MRKYADMRPDLIERLNKGLQAMCTSSEDAQSRTSEGAIDLEQEAIDVRAILVPDMMPCADRLPQLEVIQREPPFYGYKRADIYHSHALFAPHVSTIARRAIFSLNCYMTVKLGGQPRYPQGAGDKVRIIQEGSHPDLGDPILGRPLWAYEPAVMAAYIERTVTGGTLPWHAHVLRARDEGRPVTRSVRKLIEAKCVRSR